MHTWEMHWPYVFSKMAPQKEVRIKDISFPVVRNALNAGLLSFQCLMWWTHETAVILDEQVIKTTFRFLLFHSRLCH